MLSAQCDELRAMAESVGLAMPQAATLMMEAADTIWELRSQCADLVDERERLFQANVEKNGEVLRLVNENAKLRELVDYMTPIALYAASERERDRMRELGAEVGL